MLGLLITILGLVIGRGMVDYWCIGRGMMNWGMVDDWGMVDSMMGNTWSSMSRCVTGPR